MYQRFAVVTLLNTAALIFLAGCRSGGIPLLNLLPTGKTTTVIGLAADPKPLFADDKIDPINPLERFEPLRRAAQDTLGHPVLLDFCMEIQVCPNLDLGLYQFVLLTPAQFNRLPTAAREKYTLLATSLDMKNRAGRSGLLVVPSDSKVKLMADLRGKKVCFGPERDERVNAAGLRLLEQNGLKKGDLALDALPIPGSIKVLPNPRAVSQCVLNGTADAGFIDEAFFETLPAGSPDRAEPAQDKFRVIGRTGALPDWIMVAGPKADTKARAELKNFLLKFGGQSKVDLSKLGVAGFGEPRLESAAQP